MLIEQFYYSNRWRRVHPVAKSDFTLCGTVAGFADKVNTGGTMLYINPGVVAAATDRISMYAFVQVPIYQDLNGIQLAPRFIPTVGVRYSF